MNDSNSRKNNLQDFENSQMDMREIHKWYEGMCMSWAKIPKPWQVTRKIIEWLFLQFIFYILQMTQTQEIITHRVSKIHKWIHGDVYIRGKVY